MAEAQAQTLPMPADPAASTTSTGTLQESQSPVAPNGQDTVVSPRELLIGGAVLLVLMVLFFFVKSSFATWLVSRRIEPQAANTSGWSLYLLLTIIGLTTITAVIRIGWLESPLIYIPLALVVLLLLVVVVRTARR